MTSLKKVNSPQSGPMKIFIFSFLIFCSLSGLASTLADEKLPILPQNERDPRTFCPYEPGFSNEHLLIFVDVTDGISEQQMSLLKNDILTDDLLSNVGLYSKVSLMIMDGNEPVTSLEPQLTICRPKSGKKTSSDKRDHFDILTENRQRLDLEYQIGYLRRFRENAIKLIKGKAESHDKSGKTPLMEAIHEITRSSAIDFGDDYDKKKLIIVSNMYHNSDTLPLDKVCMKRIYRQSFSFYRYRMVWKCPSFKDLKNKRANKFYLETKIRPKFKGETDVKLWILHRQQESGGIRDSSLLTFWQDYFDHVLGDITFLEPEFESDPSS